MNSETRKEEIGRKHIDSTQSSPVQRKKQNCDSQTLTHIRITYRVCETWITGPSPQVSDSAGPGLHLRICIFNKLPGDAAAAGTCFSVLMGGVETSSIGIPWQFVRNAGCLAPLWTYWIRLCLLTSSLFACPSLRIVVLGQYFSALSSSDSNMQP